MHISYMYKLRYGCIIHVVLIQNVATLFISTLKYIEKSGAESAKTIDNII